MASVPDDDAGQLQGSGPELGESEDAVQGGFNLSSTAQRMVKVNSGCSGTLIDPWWVLTARHCLPNAAGQDGAGDNDPSRITITLGNQTRKVTHVALHPDHLDRVDVMMLRLTSPFTNVTDLEMPIYTGTTEDLIGETVLCNGYTGTSFQLTGEWFEVIEATQYEDTERWYELEQPNPNGAQLVAGDSGSSCRLGGAITGVHKGAGQTSAQAWADWAIDRRDCAGFDPNDPQTGFCSEACPCDVGEGDCDSNAQCQPGLHCVATNSTFGLPSGYSVCERIKPISCGTFNVASPDADFCHYVVDGEICTCNHGQGDCDKDQDCGGSLECQSNTGYAVGLPSDYDICVYPVAPGCAPYRPDVDDTAFCTADCPCDLGQGDCDNDNECRGGLICKADVGAQFGKDPGFDMCVKP